MVSENDIKRVAKQIGAAINAERVVLFGSYSRGQPGRHSDVDLMIITESKLPRFKRSRGLYKMFRPYPFGMDLVVYTPQEIEKGKRSPLSFVSTVLKEGKVLYVRRNRNR